MRVALVSLGCPKNLVDSEVMLASLAEAGCLVLAPFEDSDVVVVNTCGFLADARDESMEVIEQALELKRDGRVRRVVVAGCLPSREGSGLLGRLKGVDAVVGVNDRQSLLAAVTGSRRLERVSDAPQAALSDGPRLLLTPPHTAYLRIAEGCSQRCTFCTIPAIRGPFRSKPPQEVVAEAAQLIAGGAVELNVIAQDTTGYGRDLPGRWNLPRLLRQLAALDGARWLRLLYTYPRRFSDELIDVLADGGPVLPYVDIPLQHIADGVLRRMGRGVSRRTVESLLGRLRDRVPGVAVRTTFIVGFPGESDREFQELLEFVEAFGFEAAGAFEFSPEPGTPAADMAGQVPPDVRAQRREALMLAQQAVAFRANQARVGKPIEVLVDGVDGEGRCVGRSPRQAPDIDGVCYLTDHVDAGTLITATVVDSDGYDLVVDAGQGSARPRRRGR